MSRNGTYRGKVVSPEAASMVDLYLEDLSRYPLLTPEEEDSTAGLVANRLSLFFRSRSSEQQGCYV